MTAPFWEKPLGSMTPDEWEALCDRCGKCCAVKLEDADTGQVHYTSVTCRLFDNQTCQCGNYPLRRQLVEGCVQLTMETLEEACEWLPTSCAYRRLHEGRGLASWHPLISGQAESVHEAGVSLRGRGIPEYDVAEEDFEDHIVEEDF
ncbi:YcgN family cysteine cluster protein [Rhodobacteraceae bacterium NNCM2]|nr:YcgN family cysteine cluster protein [Coraliihabitans acroporae]